MAFGNAKMGDALDPPISVWWHKSACALLYLWVCAYYTPIGSVCGGRGGGGTDFDFSQVTQANYIYFSTKPGTHICLHVFISIIYT